MSKKSFRDNPALQFMSRVEKEVNDKAKEETREIKEIANSFRVAAPIAFEAKSKRFNMLMRPSVFANLKEMSEKKGTSVNDLINKIVENYIETNGI